jgi:hypothetical protein
MVIGDKVRMLHSHGEGVVTKVEGEMAVVMLSQGIEIPVPKKHLVVVATRQEAIQVQKSGTQGKPMLDNKNTGMLFLQEGLYLAGIPRSPMLLDFFLVNQSDFQLSVLVYKLARPAHQFHAHIIIGPKSIEAIEGTFPKQESNHQLGLAFQFLKFHPGRGNPTRPGEYRLAFSQIPWEKTRQRIPLLEKEGFLIQLDGEQVLADPEKLRESMLQGQAAIQEPMAKTERRMAFREVDLHIEKLSDAHRDLSAAEILDMQIRHFEITFDRAIAEGLEKLIVIHGVGNGILRNEVHKRLSASRHIRHFKDARKERFGYGATEIEF